ncbi:MAG: LytR/AlgR family response regulator transcription factor [Lewinella sp.]|jgi:DNA-binding LytR/AlgR family response regulator|uniref:LytR/AlgR family response regulator transcription factor n=1 Tax=Lewinella sp. TaxID=2004506 RepID=UPI003D6A58A9
MNTLNALIIDDEPLAHKVILKYAEDVPFLNIVGQVYQATDAYALLQQHSIDLLFLDIQMPKLKGLDFLRTLDRKPLVIITSAYEEYALEGYELQVCDYLLKPFRFERFLKAVHQAQKRSQPASPISPLPTMPPAEEAPDQLFLKVDKRFLQINLRDIICLESYGNYVKVWTGDNFLLTPRTLTSFEEELPSEQFARVHKSFILQKTRINYLEGNQIFMTNGMTVPIGKSYRSTVKAWTT